jgi:hypothetical protein
MMFLPAPGYARNPQGRYSIKPVHPGFEVQGKWRDGLIVSEPFAKAMLVVSDQVRFSRRWF